MNNYSESIEKIPFFFILGRPRSGTTLLQTLFDTHPNVIIPPESAVITECYDRFRHVKVWQKKDIYELIDFLYDLRKFDTWKIDRKTLTNNLLSFNGEFNFNLIIRIIYNHYQSSFKKENILLFGDKNPRYSKYPAKMKAIFPDARFIHIVRDHRDHILSMQRVKLLNGNLPLIAQVWKKSQKETFRFISNYKDKVLSVRYEDFAGDPETHQKRMCSFLNIPYDDNMLNFYQEKDKIGSDELKKNQLFHSNLYKPVSTGNVEKWKSKMNESDVKRADYYVGKTAELSGYQRKYSKRSLWDFHLVFSGYLYIYSYYMINFLVSKVPIKLRKKIKRQLRNVFPLGQQET
jgi:hypothetical protein